MGRKKENQLLGVTEPTACACGGKIVWKNKRLSVCMKCYEEQIHPQVTATAAEIAFQKRLREVTSWVEKHPEYKTKREACMHMLKKRGLTHVLPESLK